MKRKTRGVAVWGRIQAVGLLALGPFLAWWTGVLAPNWAVALPWVVAVGVAAVLIASLRAQRWAAAVFALLLAPALYVGGMIGGLAYAVSGYSDVVVLILCGVVAALLTLSAVPRASSFAWAVVEIVAAIAVGGFAIAWTRGGEQFTET